VWSCSGTRRLRRHRLSWRITCMRVSPFRLTVCLAFCCALLGVLFLLLTVSPAASHTQANRLSQVRIWVDSLGAITVRARYAFARTNLVLPDFGRSCPRLLTSSRIARTFSVGFGARSGQRHAEGRERKGHLSSRPIVIRSCASIAIFSVSFRGFAWLRSTPTSCITAFTSGCTRSLGAVPADMACPFLGRQID